jgi:hypothetical protein
VGTFRKEWNDFLGGYYVGPSGINQPDNTWIGENIILADDDGAVIPAYQPQTLTLSASTGSLPPTGDTFTGGILDRGSSNNTTWSDPTYFNGSIYLTAITSGVGYLYIIDLTSSSTATVQRRTVLASGALRNLTPPVVVPNTTGTSASTDAYIYCCFGTSSYYQVWKGNNYSIATTTPASGAALGKIDGLIPWGARLIAWSTNSAKMIFSNALDYTTVAATNYVNVGYDGDGITSIIPRQFDLIVAKPGGWYSLTGVLGTNAALRLINDTIGTVSQGTYPANYYGDSIAQHNSNIFFTTATSSIYYAINLFVLNGTRVDIGAYQRFGTSMTNLRLAKTNMGYFTLSGLLAQDTATNNKYIVYIIDQQDRWTKLSNRRLITSSSNSSQTRFSVAKSKITRYSNQYDQYLYLTEVIQDTGVENKLAVAAIIPNGIEPGKTAGASTFSSGTITLANVTTPVQTLLKKVFVEAEIMQLPANFYSTSASPTMTVTATQNSIDYANYSSAVAATSSFTHTAPTMNTIFGDRSSSQTIASQVRTLTFDVNGFGYGYDFEISIQFSGFRIRRVWVEGMTR